MSAKNMYCTQLRVNVEQRVCWPPTIFLSHLRSPSGLAASPTAQGGQKEDLTKHNPGALYIYGVYLRTFLVGQVRLLLVFKCFQKLYTSEGPIWHGSGKENSSTSI